MIIILISTVLVFFGAFYLWHLMFSKTPNASLAAGDVRIGNATFMVELATTTTEKMRGLSFRQNLASGTGMFFTFSPGIQNFWMKDMHFPIDIIWIAGDRVVGFAENAKPEPGVSLLSLKIYESPSGVDKVLEVNAGVVAKDNIKIGDPVSFSEGTE